MCDGAQYNATQPPEPHVVFRTSKRRRHSSASSATEARRSTCAEEEEEAAAAPLLLLTSSSSSRQPSSSQGRSGAARYALGLLFVCESVDERVRGKGEQTSAQKRAADARGDVCADTRRTATASSSAHPTSLCG